MDRRPWHDSWPGGLDYALDYPPVLVTRLLESAAARNPSSVAIIFQVGEGVTSYAELLELSRRFATALTSLGVGQGDVVAIQLPNSPQFAIAYYGVLSLGAVVTPVSPLLSEDELAHQLADAGAEVLVGLDLFLAGALAVRARTPLREVVVTSVGEVLPPFTPFDVSPFGKGVHSFRRMLDDNPPRRPNVTIDPNLDVAHLAYTGGTTGVSKGVVLTHRAVVANTLQFAHWTSGGRPAFEKETGLVYPEETETSADFPLAGANKKSLIVVPWFHAMGTIGYLNFPVYSGNTMVVHPRFDAGAFLGDVARHQVGVFGGAPSLFHALMNHPAINTTDLSSVRFVASGAAPLPMELLSEMRRRLPQAMIMEAYGMTEMTMGATANPACRGGRQKPGSVGIPIFDTDVKIVGLDDPARELEIGEIGEVCLKGPQMMRWYHNKPDETAAVLRDGWIHSGDIGRLDGDGYLFILDRKKDMLIYKGYNVYPRELEEVLFAHPSVRNCAVIGKPDPAVGEYPKAFVELEPGAIVEPEAILAFVAERVASYKKIREIEFVDAIPVSLVGKALKRELRQRELEGTATGSTESA